MNWVDLGILSLILLSSITGFFQGFVKELLALLAWLLAFGIALLFLDDLAHLLKTMIPFADLRLGISLISLFLFAFILLEWIIYLIINSIGPIQLFLTDRLLGTLFGMIRGGIIIIVLMMCAGVTQLPTMNWWQKSFFIQNFKSVVILLRSQLPIEIATQFSFEPAPEQISF